MIHSGGYVPEIWIVGKFNQETHKIVIAMLMPTPAAGRIRGFDYAALPSPASTMHQYYAEY